MVQTLLCGSEPDPERPSHVLSSSVLYVALLLSLVPFFYHRS